MSWTEEFTTTLDTVGVRLSRTVDRAISEHPQLRGQILTAMDAFVRQIEYLRGGEAGGAQEAGVTLTVDPSPGAAVPVGIVLTSPAEQAIGSGSATP